MFSSYSYIGFHAHTRFIFISPVEELLKIDTTGLRIFQVTQGIIIRGTQIALDVIPGLFQAAI